MQQIRLTKTPEVEKVLNYLRDKYRLLTEAEIIKVALSEFSERYYKEKGIENSVLKEQKLRQSYKHLMEEGKKIGDRLLAEKGLKREDMSEENLYRLLGNV